MFGHFFCSSRCPCLRDSSSELSWIYAPFSTCRKRCYGSTIETKRNGHDTTEVGTLPTMAGDATGGSTRTGDVRSEAEPAIVPRPVAAAIPDPGQAQQQSSSPAPAAAAAANAAAPSPSSSPSATPKQPKGSANTKRNVNPAGVVART